MVFLTMSCFLFFLLSGLLLINDPALAVDVTVYRSWGCDYKSIQNHNLNPLISYHKGIRKELVNFSGSTTCNLAGFEINRSKGKGTGTFMDGWWARTTATIANYDIHDTQKLLKNEKYHNQYLNVIADIFKNLWSPPHATPFSHQNPLIISSISGTMPGDCFQTGFLCLFLRW